MIREHASMLRYITLFRKAKYCNVTHFRSVFSQISFSYGARLQICEKRLLASLCLSVHLSAWNNSDLTGRIFMKFDI
jgi:hypothetical protein